DHGVPMLGPAYITNGGTAQVSGDAALAFSLTLGNGTADIGGAASLTLTYLFDGENQPGSNFIMEKNSTVREAEGYIASTTDGSFDTPADASFVQLGGVHTVTSLLEIGTDSSAHARYELDGGTLTLSTGNASTLTEIDLGSDTGSTFVQNGGTVT